ncbi:MAG TPA: 30S ribosomal protein S2 [Candidatus Paceibacterota bacterium]
MLEKLYEAGAQYGYSKSRRHPSTTNFIFGSRNRFDIINLEKTEEQLKSAINFLKSIRSTGKLMVLVGTKPESRNIIKNIAERVNAPFVNERWIGGTLTNFSEIQRRIAILNDLEAKKASNDLVFKTKKEKLMLLRKIDNLNVTFGGLRSMQAVPGVLIVVDPKKESIAVEEARRKNIPVIAIANTDCDISTLDFPIVMNDASKKSVEAALNLLINEVVQ